VTWLVALVMAMTGSVSPHEFRQLDLGMTRYRVHHITEATGVKVAPGEWRYRTSLGMGTKVVLDFTRAHKEDPMRLTQKRWCTRDFTVVWSCEHHP
jgi:hypothetical protein